MSTGSVYWAVYLATDADPTTAAEVEVGTWTGVSAVTTGSDPTGGLDGLFTGSSLSGLTEGVQYKLAAAWRNGTLDSAVEISAPFTPQTPDWTPFDVYPAQDAAFAYGDTTSVINVASVPSDENSVTLAVLGMAIGASGPTGILFEAGATGDGIGWAFNPSGTLLQAIAGEGASSAAASDTTQAYAQISTTNLLNRTVDLYLCIRPTAPGRIKIYAFESVTNKFLAMGYGDITDGSQMGTQDALGDWTGGNAVTVGVAGGTVRGWPNTGLADAFSLGSAGMPGGVRAWDNRLPSDFDDNSFTLPTPAINPIAFLQRRRSDSL